MRSAPTLKSWMTPFSSVAMLEKLALLRMAFCSAPVLSRAASRRTSVTTSASWRGMGMWIGAGTGMAVGGNVHFTKRTHVRKASRASFYKTNRGGAGDAPRLLQNEPTFENGQDAPLRGRVRDRRNRLSYLLQNELTFERLPSSRAPFTKRTRGRRLPVCPTKRIVRLRPTALTLQWGGVYRTNYAAAAVMTFSFARTGWRRDWSFRSWLRLVWKFFVTLCS